MHEKENIRDGRKDKKKKKEKRKIKIKLIEGWNGRTLSCPMPFALTNNTTFLLVFTHDMHFF